MAVSLQKGQKIDLTKGNPGLTRIIVGLGWDQAKKSDKQKGLKSLLGLNQIDCDASAVMLDEKGKSEELVYFANKTSPCGSVQLSGDNLTGEGEGDDEQITVELNEVPANIYKIVFVVNIYHCVKRKQDFGMIQNAFIRVVNSSNNTELCRFNLTDDYSGKTALITGEVYRHNTEWKFAALGEGTQDPGIRELVQRYYK